MQLYLYIYAISKLFRISNIKFQYIFIAMYLTMEIKTLLKTV